MVADVQCIHRAHATRSPTPLQHFPRENQLHEPHTHPTRSPTE